MSSVSSEIKWNPSAAHYALRVEGIDVNTFERDVIEEFRRGRSISSFDILFTSDGVDGGEIWVEKEKKQYLEEFQNFLLRRRFEPSDDL